MRASIQTLEVEADFSKAKKFLSHTKFGIRIDIHGESESILLLPCPGTVQGLLIAPKKTTPSQLPFYVLIMVTLKWF